MSTANHQPTNHPRATSNKLKLLPLAACCLLLSACQFNSQLPEQPTPEVTDDVTQAETASANFSQESLLSLLTAELAGQRNQPITAAENYSQQAASTQDPKVAERAYQIAEYIGIADKALDNALIWANSAPQEPAAQRAATLELLKAQKYNQAIEYLDQAIALDSESDNHFDFIVLAASHAELEAKQHLNSYFQRLLKDNPQQVSLLLSSAILLQQQEPEQALNQLQLISNKDVDSRVLLLKAQLLMQLERPEQSLKVTEQLLTREPYNTNIRVDYARQLIALNKLEQARSEFLTLHQQSPDEDDFRLALAYLNMDLEAWQEAMVYLHDLLARDSYIDIAYYNLGRCLEELGDTQDAIAAYSSVTARQQFLAAQQRILDILIKQDSLSQFEQQLQQIETDFPNLQLQAELMRAETLSRNHYYDLAWNGIQQALLNFPGEHRLLYTRAILAEKRGDLQQLEQDLRQIIHEDPQHAIALNALGYTLADRTSRYDEALLLIETSHQLNPDDPATLDSLGWIYYKLEQLEQALQYLEQAHAIYPDAEIAAHLGEVLWQQGKKRQARKVWQQAWQKEPNHPVLQETIERLDNRKGWLP